MTEVPSSRVSIQPSGSATCVDPRMASARGTSRSGLGPGEGRRNTLRMVASPNIMLVLLCSPVSTRLSWLVSISAPGSCAKHSSPARPPSAMACSSSRVRSGSCSAS